MLENAAHREAGQSIQRIEEMYMAAQRSMQKEIEGWYGRFAQNNQISLADARRLLTAGQLEEFRWSVEQYIKVGQNAGTDAAWLKKLENASARVHISRLEAIQLEIQQQLELLFGNQIDEIDDLLKRVTGGGYTRTAYEIQRGLGLGWDMTALDQRKLESLTAKPWTTDGRTFRDRCWTNKNELVHTLHTQMVQGMLRGDSPEKVIQALQKQFGVSRYKARRLVHTETSYFNACSTLQTYKDLGIARIEIIETLDSRTCETCGGLDGTVIPLAQYAPGVTVPPFHPNCRGTTAPYYDDMDGERAARNAGGEVYYVPASMSYADWKAIFVDGGGKDGLTVAYGLGKIGDSDGYTTIDRMEGIDFHNGEDVTAALERFRAEFATAREEHALSITTRGKAYCFTGTSGTVNPAIIGAEELSGSIGIHNHPVLKGEQMGDSFSIHDLLFSVRYGTSMEYLVSGERRNAFAFTRKFTEDEIFHAWQRAKKTMLERAFDGELVIEWEQEEIMKILNEQLEGFTFYENL